MYVLYGVLGAVSGSVANALIDRLPKNKSWVRGRSKCDKCGHVLGWHDLVPVVSYVLLGGRCRYCRQKIAVRNVILEVFLASMFAAVAGLPWLAAMVWVTTVIGVMDYESKLVSEGLIVIWAGLVVLSHLSNLSDLGNLWGLVLGVGVIGGVWVVTRGKGMGFGDVEIAAVLGWWLGAPHMALALWIAFVSGGVVGCWQLAMGRAEMKSEIAFGPFLILAGWVSVVWGKRILEGLFNIYV